MVPNWDYKSPVPVIGKFFPVLQCPSPELFQQITTMYAVVPEWKSLRCLSDRCSWCNPGYLDRGACLLSAKEQDLISLIHYMVECYQQKDCSMLVWNCLLNSKSLPLGTRFAELEKPQCF